MQAALFQLPGFARYRATPDGDIIGTHGKPLRKVRGGRAGNYYRVMLTERHGSERKRRHAYVHHLILEAFVGPRPPGHVACHKNDNGFDNRLSNLYWGTSEDNLADKYLNSLDLDSMEEAPF